MNKALRADLIELLAKWNVRRGLPPTRGRARFLKGALALLIKRDQEWRRRLLVNARNAASLVLLSLW